MLTKRDITVGFCKIVALEGMIRNALGLASLGLAFLYKQFTGTNFYTGTVSYGLLAIAIYGFLWMFCNSIGSEMISEAESEEIPHSNLDVVRLVWRCVGLMLLTISALGFANLLVSIALDYFPGSGNTKIPNAIKQWYILSLAYSFLQVALGFLLAFGPRLLLIFRPPASPKL